MKTENITQNYHPTSQSAPFRLFVGATLAAIALPLLLPLLSNWLLPAPDAVTTKEFYFRVLGTILTVCGGGGAAGAIAGSLASRFGKIAAQVAPGFATEATPNGEGISLKSGLESAALGAVSDYASDRVGGVAGALLGSAIQGAAPDAAPVENFDLGAMQ